VKVNDVVGRKDQTTARVVVTDQGKRIVVVGLLSIAVFGIKGRLPLLWYLFNDFFSMLKTTDG
jgi:hypothetical protein